MSERELNVEFLLNVQFVVVLPLSFFPSYLYPLYISEYFKVCASESAVPTYTYHMYTENLSPIIKNLPYSSYFID